MKYDELDRFRIIDAPPSVSLAANGPIEPCVEVCLDFSKVFAWRTYSSEWQLLWCALLVFPDAIHLKDARGMLFGVKHMFCYAIHRNKRLVCLSGSMCVVLAFSKGTCCSQALLRYCKRTAAELLASDILASWRWFASERNVDVGSWLWGHFRADGERRL